MTETKLLTCPVAEERICSSFGSTRPVRANIHFAKSACKAVVGVRISSLTAEGHAAHKES
jgi:hypothetical protein